MSFIHFIEYTISLAWDLFQGLFLNAVVASLGKFPNCGVITWFVLYFGALSTSTRLKLLAQSRKSVFWIALGILKFRDLNYMGKGEYYLFPRADQKGLRTLIKDAF
ncbi:hypothetical protein BHYA_0090g00410 [Botrytis hyacinthi]|uniref:Uncharacterized protein n=1 Tax=Botrytis hyacinthi TaxID=278943 RepID=A0A4Z1GSK4_9HELO|nr:hypothetical protein BHYA_0090g00410 [Botrytis hyacinthi]